MIDETLFAREQPISALTVADLETIIAEIVRRVLREEMRRAAGPSANGKTLPELFLATFGAWEDARPAEAIAAEIYESRTVSTPEVSL